MLTSQEALSFVRRCREEIGEIPTINGYNRWRDGRKEIPESRAVVGAVCNGHRSWPVVLQNLAVDNVEREQQRNRKISTYSLADCEAAIAACSKDLRHPPRIDQYEAWRKRETTTTHPSALTIIRLYDPRFPKRQCWKTALDAMDVDTESIPCRSDPKIPPFRSFEDAALIGFVIECYEAIGDVPSVYAYDQWRDAENNPEAGLYLPTSTTLIRRLGGETWKQVLKACKLDPRKKSAARRKAFAKQQKERCREALAEFVQTFGGVAEASTYFAWTNLDETRPSYTSLLYWLAPKKHHWVNAVKNAGFGKTIRVKTKLRDVLGHKPASKRKVLAVLKRCTAELGATPTLSAYRRWRYLHSELSETEVLLALTPETFSWTHAMNVSRAWSKK